MKVITSPHAPQAIGPYSQAISVGGLLFCSGQIGIDPQTGLLANGGIQAETIQVLSNIQAILTQAGLSPSHIIKSTIFLTNLDDFVLVNTLYGEFVGSHLPARSTIQVAGLPKGACIEIECIAYQGNNTSPI